MQFGLTAGPQTARFVPGRVRHPRPLGRVDLGLGARADRPASGLTAAQVPHDGHAEPAQRARRQPRHVEFVVADELLGQRVVDDDTARPRDVRQTTRAVDRRAEDVSQVREHRPGGQADAQLGHPLIGADPLEEVESDRRAGLGVVGDEDDLVTEGLDDAAPVRADDLRGHRLEPLDELGELPLRQPPHERREIDHVGEPDGSQRAGALDLLVVGHEPADRRGQVPPPRVDEEGLDIVDEREEELTRALRGLRAQLVVPQPLVALALGGQRRGEVEREVLPGHVGAFRSGGRLVQPLTHLVPADALHRQRAEPRGEPVDTAGDRARHRQPHPLVDPPGGEDIDGPDDRLLIRQGEARVLLGRGGETERLPEAAGQLRRDSGVVRDVEAAHRRRAEQALDRLGGAHRRPVLRCIPRCHGCIMPKLPVECELRHLLPRRAAVRLHAPAPPARRTPTPKSPRLPHRRSRRS